MMYEDRVLTVPRKLVGHTVVLDNDEYMTPPISKQYRKLESNDIFAKEARVPKERYEKARHREVRDGVMSE